MAGPLTVDLAPRALALFHAALVHAGPTIARLQVLVAALIKALCWGGGARRGHSEPLLPPVASALPPRHPAHLCRSPGR